MAQLCVQLDCLHAARSGSQLPWTFGDMTDTFFDPDSVSDRESFVRFVEWLIADRVKADDVERADPERFKWGGANGWQNGSISSFLDGAIVGAEAQDDWGNGVGPSWRDLAVFLYLGKIYE